MVIGVNVYLNSYMNFQNLFNSLLYPCSGSGGVAVALSFVCDGIGTFMGLSAGVAVSLERKCGWISK